MMNVDGARAGDPVVKFQTPRKGEKRQRSDKTGGVTTNPGAGVTDPVFESEERKLNIEIPEGWSAVR
jgi:hypothetical protein